MDNPVSAPMVLKRNGALQPFRPAKILQTLKTISWDLDTNFLKLNSIVDIVVAGISAQITADELLTFTASAAASMTAHHPDYSILAGRLLTCYIHKTVDKSFACWVQANATVLQLHPFLVRAVELHGPELDDAIVHSRDFDLNYVSVRTLMHSYLGQVDGQCRERPQFMYMRVAIAIHETDLPGILRTYEALSRRLYTHATPVLYNAGTTKPNFASCFLYHPDPASASSLLRSASEIDTLWSSQGGVGVYLGAVPSRRLFPVPRPGIMQLLRIYDSHASYINSSDVRRSPVATAYIHIWHDDVRQFVECRTTRCPPSAKVNNIFLGLMVPDLFMIRLRMDMHWTLFDPSKVPGLDDLYGDEFVRAYEAFEREGHGQPVRASELFGQICSAQRETGGPFIHYLDAINNKNNQKHLGVVKTSNLCTEIVQYSSTTETAVCTLASIALPRFVRDDQTFDFEALHEVVKLAVRNTDAFIDLTRYPTTETRNYALRARAVGIGGQGLADCFRNMHMAFGSSAARAFNVDVYETIYHAALEASCELAKVHGACPAWSGSPASDGDLQMDLWERSPSSRHNFAALRELIRKYGLRNSVLTAQMPTASTSRIMGNSEGTEPRTSNITTYHLQSGEYTEICPSLVRDLVRLGIWSEDVRSRIVRENGSIARLPHVSPAMKAVYRTVWEIDTEDIIDMAADRGPYIDQSESLTLYVERPTVAVLRSLQMRAWSRGLKTGMYYLRCRAPSFPLPYGVKGGRVPLRTLLKIETPPSDDDDLPPPLEPAITPRSPTPVVDDSAAHAALPTCSEEPSIRLQVPIAPDREYAIVPTSSFVAPLPPVCELIEIVPRAPRCEPCEA